MTTLLLDVRGVEGQTQGDQHQPAEPDDDARDGEPVAALRPVGPPDLRAGDEAEDDAREDRAGRTARHTNRSSDAMASPFVLGGAVATPRAAAGVAVRRVRAAGAVGAGRARCRRHGRSGAVDRCGPGEAGGDGCAGAIPARVPPRADRSTARAGTTCRQMPTTIRDPVRCRSCRDRSVCAECAVEHTGQTCRLPVTQVT